MNESTIGTAACKKLVNNKEERWRVRVGDYRIFYAIDDDIQIIDVHHIGNRRDFIAMPFLTASLVFPLPPPASLPSLQSRT
jgi:hypothetical protein